MCLIGASLALVHSLKYSTCMWKLRLVSSQIPRHWWCLTHTILCCFRVWCPPRSTLFMAIAFALGELLFNPRWLHSLSMMFSASCASINWLFPVTTTVMSCVKTKTLHPLGVSILLYFPLAHWIGTNLIFLLAAFFCGVACSWIQLLGTLLFLFFLERCF